MVQIGNEISNGLLWNDGRPWTGGANNLGFDRLAALLAAGIDGAKDGAGPGQEPLIMIHHDRGDRWNTTSYFFDKLVDRNLDFDVIGYSYYPKWHYSEESGAGSVQDVEQNLHNTANRYGKPVVIVETGFAFRGAQFEPEYEFDVSEQGQQEFLETLVDIVKGVPGGLGQGVFWWYPEARPVSGLSVWENGRYGLFDQQGELLPAISAYAPEIVPEPVMGDYNGDSTVNAADYVVWRNTLGRVGRTLAADGDGDGRIDQDDFDVWVRQFGSQAAPQGMGNAAVPEPSSTTVLLLGGAMFHRCWRRR
jgi:arabinogalactan endo-1,4-beta-galactosidase